MNRISHTVLLLALGGGLVFNAHARPPHHSGPFSFPSAHAAAPGMLPQQPFAPLVEARVERLLITPYGEIDGLLLSGGQVVKFPSHLGERLAAVAAPGQTVRVFGRVHSRHGRLKAEAIVNVATGASVADEAPAWHQRAQKSLPRHLRAMQLTELSAEGRIAMILPGHRRGAGSVLLEDGTLVRLPRHAAWQVQIAPGQQLAVRGVGTRNQYGTAIEALSLGTSAASLQPVYPDRR